MRTMDADTKITVKVPGTGILLLTIALVVLKALGYIDWAWAWVFAPLWIGCALALLILLIVLAVSLRQS